MQRSNNVGDGPSVIRASSTLLDALFRRLLVTVLNTKSIEVHVSYQIMYRSYSSDRCGPVSSLLGGFQEQLMEKKRNARNFCEELHYPCVLLCGQSRVRVQARIKGWAHMP